MKHSYNLPHDPLTPLDMSLIIIRRSILGKRNIVCMHQTRRLPACHTKYAGQLRNSFPPRQYSVVHHSEPERRKTSEEEKSEQVSYQMWSGPPSSITGEAANNHFYVWVCRYPIPVATQNGVDCTCTCTGNLPHQAPVLFNRKNSTVSMHLMLGSVMLSFQEKCQCPT
jgi:hypothetical protein